MSKIKVPGVTMSVYNQLGFKTPMEMFKQEIVALRT